MFTVDNHMWMWGLSTGNAKKADHKSRSLVYVVLYVGTAALLLPPPPRPLLSFLQTSNVTKDFQLLSILCASCSYNVRASCISCNWSHNNTTDYRETEKCLQAVLGNPIVSNRVLSGQFYRLHSELCMQDPKQQLPDQQFQELRSLCTAATVIRGHPPLFYHHRHRVLPYRNILCLLIVDILDIGKRIQSA